MKQSVFNTKTIVAIGIGTALFFVLARFVIIPTGIPNTEIQTSYALLSLISAVFGPIAGFFVGIIGHALKDITAYGSAWWSWVIVSGLTGLGIGFFFNKFKITAGEFKTKQIISFNIVQVIVQLIGWGLVAPVLDILIYAEPANKVFTQGLVAGFWNIISVGVIGTLLLIAYAKTRTQKGSLSYEE